MSVLVSKWVRICVLTAITIAIAAGDVSAARRPFSRTLDSALAGVAGQGGHRTRAIVSLREGAGLIWGEDLIWGENLVRSDRLDENVIWGDSILGQ